MIIVEEVWEHLDLYSSKNNSKLFLTVFDLLDMSH